MKKSRVGMLIIVMVILIATLAACSATTVSYKINFEVDGAQYKTIDTGGLETISLPTDPTKAGFAFDGWYFDKDIWEQPLTINSFLDAKLTSSMTVYAKWLQNEAQTTIYTVTFNANGGSVVEAQKIADGSFANQPTAPTKAGFSFDGWCKEVGCITAFNFATEKITADTTIYAKWKINSYTVTFETNGGSTVVSQTIDYNGFATAPTAPTKVGYSFDGWCKDESLTTPFAFTTEKITADTTIYAKWKINSYTVTFETNGGSTVASQIIDYNSLANQPTVPTKVGYSFDGWCKDESLTTPFAFTTEKITANTTIYAKWKINSYTVTFATNGGSTVASQTIEYNSLANQPTAPTKVGYSFDGWFKDASFATPFDFASDKITADTTIYAKWLDIFDVTFEVNGGSAVTAQKVTDSSLAGQPTDPIKTGFAFAGWYKEANFATPFNFSADKITADTTIYAKWKINSYTVTFETNGGSTILAKP